MEQFCGSTLWDVDLTWHTSDPDFTSCFQKTILSWIPVSVLWISAAIYSIFSHSKRLKTSPPWTSLNKAKVTFAVLLIFMEILRFTYHKSFERSEVSFPADSWNLGLKVGTFFLYVFWIIHSRKRGVQSSCVHFIFWFLLIICEAIILRSALKTVKTSDLKYVPTLQSITFVLIVIQFLISCWSNAPIRGKDAAEDTHNNSCPESRALFLSRLFVTWLDPLIWKGFKKPLTQSVLWELNDQDKSATSVSRFDKLWNWDEVKRTRVLGGKWTTEKRSLQTTPKQQSVIPCLLKLIGRSVFKSSTLKLTNDLLALTSPLVLMMMIKFVKTSDEETWKGYLYATALFVLAVFQTLLSAHSRNVMERVGLKVRAVFVSAIYRKSILISNAARIGSSVGEIVNLMDVDVEKVLSFGQMFNFLWCSPIQITIALYMLWTLLGHSVWSGIFVMISFNAINMWLTSKLKMNQSLLMKYKDERVKLMNQILLGIKVLKLYGWESSFSAQILKIRRKELRIVQKKLNIQTLTSFFWTCTPICMTLVTFGVYVLSDETHVLDTEKAFVSLALFNLIRMPLSLLPDAVGEGLQAFVSLKRISNFMNFEEINSTAVTHSDDEHDSVSIRSGHFSWDTQPTLENININIKKGSLVAVVGVIGSGKSSLLAAILGEIEKSCGLVNTTGTIAYVPQQAWIQNETVKGNILFGKSYDYSNYRKVMQDCALLPDLTTLPAGDATEIGEKGINLSGGQKQRISLARAVYNNADIYLLDDPLSAVDSHVAKHIFEYVIGPNGSLKEKTRILVTHGISFLNQVDSIIVMKDGKVSEAGSYESLMSKEQSAFREFLTQHSPDEVNEEICRDEILSPKAEISEPRVSSRRVSLGAETYGTFDESTGSNSKSLPVKGEKIIGVETSEGTSVKSGVYLEYIRAAGWPIFTITFIFFSLFQGFVLASNFCLSNWTNSEQQSWNKTEVENSATHSYYLIFYGGLGAGQAIMILAATFFLARGILKSSTFLHQRMLARILRAPLWFFETTPIGRILNRFSKDVDSTDNRLPVFIRRLILQLFELIGILIIIGYTFPIFNLVLIPIGALYYITKRLYVSTSRQLKRLEAVSRSPIYSHFGETLSGVSTIRAYGMQKRFIKESERRTDESLKSSFPAIMSIAWVEIRLQNIGSIVILAAAIFAVIGRENIDPGLAGLVLSSALLIVRSLSYVAFYSSEVESNIVAVERLKEYGECPQEASWEICDLKLSPAWPENGVVEFDNYETRYREGLPPVLRNINCRIEAGEKIGIVGRTGAGKSSFALALFRIIEPTGGNIRIDGVDITRIGLHDLRRRITVIPQDPTLFSGKLRLNLDPESEMPDSTLWRALELAHLKEFISTLPDGLDHKMVEGGENFSVGQRQLVCLARALLRKTKVLVLDEATAAVDLDTDDLIQQTIRTEFIDSTVFTIAHRLNTIMDSRRVMVLGNGEILEFDTPLNLLQLKYSVFYSLAKEAGLV